jgi:phenylalanyl-tRNA synthetase beta chain
MRTTIAPSLLQVVADNQERFREQAVFEVANAYLMQDGHHQLPNESLELACAYFGQGDILKKAKGFMEHLLDELGIPDVVCQRVSEQGFWHPGRTAQVFKGDALLATIGEVAPKVLGNLKIDGRVAMVHSYLEEVFRLAGHGRSYTPPSAFPDVRRDLAIVVDARTEYADMERAIGEIDPLITSVEWFDTYQGKGLPEGKKSVAMHLTFASPERTLTSEEADALMEKIHTKLKSSFKAEMR